LRGKKKKKKKKKKITCGAAEEILYLSWDETEAEVQERRRVDRQGKKRKET